MRFLSTAEIQEHFQISHDEKAGQQSYNQGRDEIQCHGNCVIQRKNHIQRKGNYNRNTADKQSGANKQAIVPKQPFLCHVF